MKKVFIHGLGQTPNSWNEVLSIMKEEKEYICPNLAEGIKKQSVNYKNLYQIFSELCDKYEEQIHLCGLSLGGVLALNYAIDKPEKVKSLVLIATPYKMPKTLLKIQNICFRFMPKSMFRQMGFEKKEYISLCKSMMELDFSNGLHKVLCPALIICGEKDQANRKAARKMAALLNRSHLKFISGAGHEVNVEAPDKLGKLLLKFYRSIEI